MTSNIEDDTLSVFDMSMYTLMNTGLGGDGSGRGSGAAGLTLVCILGGVSSPAPMQFMFRGAASNNLAFMGPVSSRLLAVADVGRRAVHVVDVVGRTHVGYVAAPLTITAPRGVAATGTLVAVSAWNVHGDAVYMFEGSRATWAIIRVVVRGSVRIHSYGSVEIYINMKGHLKRPNGIRFSSDGTELAVAEAGKDCLSLFRVQDGSFQRHVATDICWPHAVEQCEDGWLVPSFNRHGVQFHGSDCVHGRHADQPTLGKLGHGDGEFSCPTAVALVPGLGLVVRDCGGLQFFATPEVVAMASMSAARVAWMVAVRRGQCHRELRILALVQNDHGDKRVLKKTKA